MFYFWYICYINRIMFIGMHCIWVPQKMHFALKSGITGPFLWHLTLKLKKFNCAVELGFNCASLCQKSQFLCSFSHGWIPVRVMTIKEREGCLFCKGFKINSLPGAHWGYPKALLFLKIVHKVFMLYTFENHCIMLICNDSRYKEIKRHQQMFSLFNIFKCV